MLYQLSYFRNSRLFLMISALDFVSSVGHYHQVTPSLLARPPWNPSKINFEYLYGHSVTKFKVCGRRWIRTTEGINQQIYSLPHLATLVFSQKNFEPMEGVEPTTPRLQITCSSQLSYIGIVFPFSLWPCFRIGIAKIGIIFYSPKLLLKFLRFPPKF